MKIVRLFFRVRLFCQFPKVQLIFLYEDTSRNHSNNHTIFNNRTQKSDVDVLRRNITTIGDENKASARERTRRSRP